MFPTSKQQQRTSTSDCLHLLDSENGVSQFESHIFSPGPGVIIMVIIFLLYMCPGAVRASSIFPILSVILLFMGGLCIAASEFYKSRHNIILSSGILFVSAGEVGMTRCPTRGLGGGQDREITVGCSTDHGFACSHSCFPLCKVPSPVKELDLSLITALCRHGHHGRHVAAVHRSPRDTDVLVFTCGCSLVLGTSSPSESGVSDGRTSLCFSPSLSRCLSCSPCC